MISGLGTNSMDLYFSVGIPNGYTELLAGVTFAPVLISLSTNIVSAASSTIQATVIGAGVNDKLTLVDSVSSTDLCMSSKVLEYGILECELDPAFDYSAGVSVSVKAVDSGTIYACSATDLTTCDVTLIAEQPAFTTVEKVSSSQLRITGSLFPTSGFTCSVLYANVESDTCTINSVSEVVADFINGISISETEITPILGFVDDDISFEHLALAGEPAVLANPFTLTSATSGITSSFAGGRQMTVVADGLSSKVISGDAEVRVC